MGNGRQARGGLELGVVKGQGVCIPSGEPGGKPGREGVRSGHGDVMRENSITDPLAAQPFTHVPLCGQTVRGR